MVTRSEGYRRGVPKEEEAIGEGFVRGAGRSNEDTFAVFVPLPRLRWQRHDGNWEFRGDSQAESAEAARTLLGL